MYKKVQEEMRHRVINEVCWMEGCWVCVPRALQYMHQEYLKLKLVRHYFTLLNRVGGIVFTNGNMLQFVTRASSGKTKAS